MVLLAVAMLIGYCVVRFKYKSRTDYWVLLTLVLFISCISAFSVSAFVALFSGDRWMVWEEKSETPLVSWESGKYLKKDMR